MLKICHMTALAIAMSAGLASGAARAQAPPGAPAMDLLSDDPFTVPDAPQRPGPDGPPPDDLCVIPTSHDFDADRHNPGLTTGAQYRRWATSGRDLSNPRHMYFLGLMHEYGHHTSTNLARAKALYEDAIKQDFVPAINRRALIACAQGYTCTSARLSYKSGMLRNKDGRMALSRQYRWGLGVPYDIMEAYRWGRVGMERTKGNWLISDPDGSAYLEDLERDMSAPELQDAQKLITSFKQGFIPKLWCQQDY